ncbi:MAG: protein phosphatase CheZ [Proteobacteria bacterium]|nr:protein phosphatase CheZ [Pseudomonadota bacterium]
MAKPTRPFTSERPVTRITGSSETVTNSDILNAFHDLSAHFKKAEPPRLFTSERTRAVTGREVTNNDLLQTFNDLSASLREMMDGASGKEETSVDVQAESGQAPTGQDLAREKVAKLKSADPDTDKLLLARQELETVIKSTDAAANEIMNLSDGILASAEKIRQDQSSGEVPNMDDHLASLEDFATNLLMACGFQDLTGQRINKVANTLQGIEDQIDDLFQAMDISEGTGRGGLDTTTADDERPDTDLLHGPQDEGKGISQDEIDALFD